METSREARQKDQVARKTAKLQGELALHHPLALASRLEGC